MIRDMSAEAKSCVRHSVSQFYIYIFLSNIGLRRGENLSKISHLLFQLCSKLYYTCGV